MLTVGNSAHERPSLNITLASNANPILYPNNSLTDFTNALPRPIGPGQNVHEMYIQLKSISLSYQKSQAFLRKKEAYPLMMVYLKELEPQMVGGKKIPLLTTVDLNQVLTNHNKVFGKYVVIDFENSPVLRLGKNHFQNLSIKITDEKGELYPLKRGPPTLVQLTISSTNMEREFTITCLSHPPGNELFPNNTATEFHSQLYKQMELSNWEVALASIAIPRHMADDTKFMVFLAHVENEEDTYYTAERERRVSLAANLGQIKTFKSFTKKLEAAISLEGERMRGLVHVNEPEDPTTDKWTISNRSQTHFLQIFFNPEAAYLLGYELERTQLTVAKATREELTLVPSKEPITGPKWIAGSEDKPFTGVSADMVMVYCDKVKPSIVGHSSVPLIGLVPLVWNKSVLKKQTYQPSQILYEPLHLVYYDIVEGTITDLGFSLRRGDGQPIDIKEETKNHFKETGGTMITLRLRPKPLSSTRPEQPLAVNYERRWRTHTYKHGPGGFY
jgi:hypothetical protein